MAPAVAAPSFLSRNSVMLFACAFLLQSDQNLLAPHLSAVADEFGMSDVERDEKLGGELAMGLFLLGAPAALALGAAADAHDRVRLFAAILVVGGAASAGTAFATTYGALFWWRALTGVSLGASLPVTFSLLADLFSPSMRTAASSRVGVAMSAGAGFGQFVSGFLGAALGWRAPFLFVGALFLALGICCFTIGVFTLAMNEFFLGRMLRAAHGLLNASAWRYHSLPAWPPRASSGS